MTVKTGHFPSVGHIQDANKKGGRYFFDPATMRGFRSRIHNALYGGCIFVTSNSSHSEDTKNLVSIEFVWQWLTALFARS